MERAARYKAREALQTVLHSRALARAVCNHIWRRSTHREYMDEMRELLKLLQFARPRKKSVNGVLGLREELKRERFAKSRVFVITDSKVEQQRQAAAIEHGRTGKAGFVAH